LTEDLPLTEAMPLKRVGRLAGQRVIGLGRGLGSREARRSALKNFGGSDGVTSGLGSLGRSKHRPDISL